MKNLILYHSKYGTTTKVAETIKNKLTNVSASTIEKFDDELINYDCIYLGSSTYMGRVHKSLKQFIRNNKKVLLTKEVKVFIVGTGPDNVDRIIEHNFDKESIGNFSFTHVGGEYLYNKMTFIDRFIIKRVAGVTENSSHINNEAIESLVK